MSPASRYKMTLTDFLRQSRESETLYFAQHQAAQDLGVTVVMDEFIFASESQARAFHARVAELSVPHG